jgi:hypothetical protein
VRRPGVLYKHSRLKSGKKLKIDDYDSFAETVYAVEFLFGLKTFSCSVPNDIFLSTEENITSILNNYSASPRTGKGGRGEERRGGIVILLMRNPLLNIGSL